MYVITVIPIARGIGKENLSYFTASHVLPGSLVSVPLRKKIIDGLVVESIDAREMRSVIKTADFALRKVNRLVARPFLSEAFMETARETSRFHAATMGATLNVLLPKKILETSSQRDSALLKTVEKYPCIFQKSTISLGTLRNRIDTYKKEIEKVTMAIIVTPTKERQNLFKRVFDEIPHVQIILPSELITIHSETSLIIIEEDNSSSYKSLIRPFIDLRFAIETYAKKIGANVLKGHEALDPKVDKIIEELKKEEDKPFTSIGKNLTQDLRSLKDAPGHIFILATRRGHSGTVLCQDCGLAVNCVRCDAPLTLHMKSQKEDFNNLTCHHCGYKTTALKKCTRCGGWRLKAFGLGVEKIEEEVKTFVKKHSIKTYIQRIDSTLKLTPKKIKDFINTHYEKEHSILIATEIVLPYLVASTLDDKRTDTSYIASLDTLLSLPDFSINEKIWKLASLLDDFTKKKVVIQTRNAKNPLLLAWKENDKRIFWEKEMKERETFNYPPHGVFIKITLKGKKEKIADEMREIAVLVSKWKPMLFPAFIKSINNQHILHALITLSKTVWVDEELLRILLSLPPSTTIEVNPRSLL